MLFEFQERMIMVEDCRSSVLKGDCVWVIHTLKKAKEFAYVHKGGKGLLTLPR